MADGTLDTGLTEAPFHADVCQGETPGKAFWATTEDGVRIRLGLWQAPDPKGTVLLFPGRTEYIEKYAQSADELAKRGFTTFAIDWRGQGCSDRPLADRRVGHVEDFAEYQTDIAAMLARAKALDLPKPFYLLSHSMGGCIGLRALFDGLPVKAAAFTGPMWGIRIAPHLQPVALVLKHILPAVGLGHLTPPTTVPEPYVINAQFDDNLLTRDRDMWQMMRNQIDAHPEVSLGGPSIIWLREALAECNALARMPAPAKMPCVAYMGTNERIVHVGRVHARMSGWPGSHLELIQGAEHEVLMESPEIRAHIFDDMTRRFATA